MSTQDDNRQQGFTAVHDDERCGPIPFPIRRARMSIRPPHLHTVEDENIDAAHNVDDTVETMELVSRRIDELARHLNCLWFYDDNPASGDDDPPSAA